MTAQYSCRTTTSAPVTTICDKPDWIRDEKGNQTDFTYDLAHGGGVATVTRPAPTPGGIRPQTRYTYGQVQAYFFKGDQWRAGLCLRGPSLAGSVDLDLPHPIDLRRDGRRVGNGIRLRKREQLDPQCPPGLGDYAGG
ncbi:hypothetical protein ACRAWD_10700 [Caulobacter segnis]